MQSTAALVLAVTGRIDYSTFLFANVGDDSENPNTLAYVNEVAIPYADDNGLEIVSLHRNTSIYRHVLSDRRSVVIPIRSIQGGFGRRGCTDYWKRKIISGWQMRHGATKLKPHTLGIGISFDEIGRMRSSSGVQHQLLTYPLVDNRLTRQDCVKIIESAHLPVPPKSSCWFCPFKSRREWIEMRRNSPELFESAVVFEEQINEKRAVLGYMEPVFLHGEGLSLDVSIPEDESYYIEPYAHEPYINSEEVCESGYCFL